ncbi:MAG: hypothetical protein ACJAUL_003771, partial [Paraglaciecola sp.]
MEKEKASPPFTRDGQGALVQTSVRTTFQYGRLAQLEKEKASPPFTRDGQGALVQTSVRTTFQYG